MLPGEDSVGNMARDSHVLPRDKTGQRYVSKMISIQVVVMVAHLCEFTRYHLSIYFKWVNFIVCK